MWVYVLQDVEIFWRAHECLEKNTREKINFVFLEYCRGPAIQLL